MGKKNRGVFDQRLAMAGSTPSNRSEFSESAEQMTFFKVDKMAPKMLGEKMVPTYRLHNWPWFGYNHEESIKYQKWKDHGVHRPRTWFTPLFLARFHLILGMLLGLWDFVSEWFSLGWYVLHLFHEQVYCLDPHLSHLVSCIVQVESCWI